MEPFLVIYHVIIVLVFLLGILCLFYWGRWKSVDPEQKRVEITATITQNTISTGVVGVSILLPLTVAILGYTLQQQKTEPVHFLFCACIFLAVSLFAALWNLFRLPSIVNAYNLANDWPTAFFMIVQLFCFFSGVIYLVLGALRTIELH